jgi:hypothetical protein
MSIDKSRSIEQNIDERESIGFNFTEIFDMSFYGGYGV